MNRCRLQALIGLAALAVAPAEAYYQYTHFLNGNTPVYEKFDVSALPNKTLTFFVVDGGPVSYAPNDDFASVLSQVRQAAIAWNSVDSSDLRVAFGGLESQPQAGNTPAGDVIFADLAPGILGIGGVTPGGAVVNGPNGPFLPVVRSTIVLTNDTSRAPGPSYLEGFFTTAVHEMGHALGLQHTWTSAAMSQDVIRNTSRARPLDADDRAGLSVLYGKNNWTIAYGSIAGRVTANGQGVALASVVAIPPIGPAVSTLTNPDGTYTISGLPANNYLLYVHPLPPDAVTGNNLGLRLPVDQNNQPLRPFDSAFRTVFFTVVSPFGTNNPQQASSLNIAPGTAITARNFSVTPESSVSMYDIVTYSYNQSRTQAISPAFVNGSAGQITVVAQANYDKTPIPQSVTILGGFSTAIQCGTVPCFTPYGSNNALAIYMNVPLGAATGPRHMVFTLPGGDIYVLPDGVSLVQRDPPLINSVTANGDGTATVAGTGFGTDSTVFFDGQPAAIQNNDGRSSLTVLPPPGYGGQVASVIVFNSDGQNSTFYQSQNPPTFTYPSSGPAQFTISATSLPANASSLVQIDGANTQFADGQVTVGFGTSDLSVRRVWVVSPTRLIANVAAAPGAAVGLSEISVISGFQMASQPAAFQTLASVPSAPALALPVVNADPGQPILFPGATVTIYGSNLGASANTTQVTLNDQSVLVLFASSSQINFLIPAGFPAGLAVLKVNNGSAASLPVQLQIDNAPPVILQISNAAGLLDTRNLAAPGDVLTATITGVDPAVAGNPSRVQVTVSGVPMAVTRVTGGPSGVQVSFVMSQSFAGSAAAVVVTVDGARSSPYSVLVR